MAGVNLITAGLAYDPYFYANAALEQLNKRLGLAFFIHRDFEEEKGQARGSTIQIRRPGRFTAVDMPIAEAAAADVTPDYLSLVLNQWKGTLMTLTDKELTYTRERFVNEHIGPQAIATADAIDQSLQALYDQFPWVVADDATDPFKDFSNAKKQLFDNLAPRTGPYFAQLDGVLQNRYETEEIFVRANEGVDSEMLQRDGFLGRKFGFDVFANQNSPTHDAGAGITASAPITDGAIAVGETSVVIDDGSLTGGLNKGDIIKFANHSQQYAVAADTTASSNAITVTFTPELRVAVGDGVAVTFPTVADSSSVGLFGHRNALAMAMAPLSELGDGRGAEIATVTDPITQLVLRSRIWYSGGGAAVFVGTDALWGVKVLDPNLLVRLQV